MSIAQDLDSYIKTMNIDGERQSIEAGFVLPTVHHMAPIPANANPFHHDGFNMGSPLVRGWMAMHAGYDNERSPMDLEYIILVNQRTGQRIRLDMAPVYPDKPNEEIPS